MSERIRVHIRSNLVGYVAVFIALGGTAVALPGRNVVQSNDIGPGEQVKNRDTKPVKGTWVADNSLTGDDIQESSLGIVPNANELDGLNSAQLSPAAGDGRTANVTLTATPQTVLTANITTARNASLLVSAAVNVFEANAGLAGAACFLQFDGSMNSVFYSATFEFRTTLPVVWAQGVGAGAHTVALLCFTGDANVFVENAGMTVSAHV